MPRSMLVHKQNRQADRVFHRLWIVFYPFPSHGHIAPWAGMLGCHARPQMHHRIPIAGAQAKRQRPRVRTHRRIRYRVPRYLAQGPCLCRSHQRGHSSPPQSYPTSSKQNELEGNARHAPHDLGRRIAREAYPRGPGTLRKTVPLRRGKGRPVFLKFEETPTLPNNAPRQEHGHGHPREGQDHLHAHRRETVSRPRDATAGI